jgi:hypothetical protein
MGLETTARPPFGQKIVPIFSFFLFGPAGKIEVFLWKVFSGKLKFSVMVKTT